MLCKNLRGLLNDFKNTVLVFKGVPLSNLTICHIKRQPLRPTNFTLRFKHRHPKFFLLQTRMTMSLKTTVYDVMEKV